MVTIIDQQQGYTPTNFIRPVVQAMKMPDLRGKILFTLAMLVVYRIAAQVPMPGLDMNALANLFANNEILGFMDLFSGGALRRMSIVALGVFPYITASIVIQVASLAIPRLQRMGMEADGRRKMNQLVHGLTVPIAVSQAFGQLMLLERSNVLSVGFTGVELLATIAAIASLTAGTMFLVWLGELITERGVGNGISLIIFAGIVASFPAIVSQGFLDSDNIMGLGFFMGIAILLVALIVLFNEATRRIPVQYGRSIFRGGRTYRQSGSAYVPLKINAAGMIPLIFAFAGVTVFVAVASYGTTQPGFIGWLALLVSDLLSPTSPVYWCFIFCLVVGFTFFYSIAIFQQQQLAANLQRNGGFVPGIRPGKPTEDYFTTLMLRLTLGGAFFLGFVAIVPYIASLVTGVQAITISSTSLLILVGVGVDTLKQIEAQLVMRQYRGFLSG